MTNTIKTDSTVRTDPRRGLTRPIVVALLAGGLLAACQSVSGHAPGPQTTAGAQAQPSQGLNRDWGSCQYRRCDFGK
jgi:hypothetical protein